MKKLAGKLTPRILSLLAGVTASLSLTSVAHGQRSWTEELSAVHKSLEQQGIHPALIYDAEGFADVSGGARRGGTYLGNCNLQLTLGLQRLVGWPGAIFFIDGLNIHGGQPSEFAGDAQQVSSIAGPNKWTLEEAWIQQNFFGNRFSILVGRYDLNSEFYRTHAADLFFNSSFGIGAEFSQSGQGGPSTFPNTSVGTRLELKPVENLVLRVAILDGVPVERPNGWDVFAGGDGWLVVSEAAFLHRPPKADQPRPLPRRFLIGRNSQLPPYDAKLAVGIWHYTASFPDLSLARGNGTPVMHEGNTGAYVIGETIFYHDDAGREMRLFGKLGLADDRVNRFGLFLGGGITAKGFIPKRPDDEIGFGFAAARNGSHYMDAQRNLGHPPNHAEVTLELPYLAPITSWLSISPDVQYVVNPNTDRHRSNALVGLIRIELSF